jgi:hypothetical protein
MPLRFLTLKARDENEISEILNVFSRDLLFRDFSASAIVMNFIQGGCPGSGMVASALRNL